MINALLSKKRTPKGLFHPPRLKFKKTQKSPIRTHDYSGRSVVGAGGIVIKTLEPVFIGPKQIEIVRRFLTRRIARRIATNTVPLWLRTVPTRPITRKGRGVRMGKGKGIVKYWVSPSLTGACIVEASPQVNTPAWFRHAARKLASRTCIFRRKMVRSSTLPLHTALPLSSPSSIIFASGVNSLYNVSRVRTLRRKHSY